MLNNYEKLPNGVMKQISPFKDEFHFEEFDPSFYVRKYESIKVQSMQNSYLRYAYLLGVLGKVPNSIVDVGYGIGDFLKVCAESRIPSVSGYDLVHEFELPERVKLITEFDDLINKYHEVITFFDSLEHFHDLSFLPNLNCNYIYISVPECHNFSDEWFENWKHRRPDEHIYHFNFEAMKALFEENGYEYITHSNIEDIIRTPVDEFPNILSCVFKKIH